MFVYDLCLGGFFCSIQHQRNTYARSSKYKYIPVIIGTLTGRRRWVGTRTHTRSLLLPFFICKLQRWRLFILPSQSFYFTLPGFFAVFFFCSVALVSGHCGEERREKPSGGITYYYLV